MCMMLYVASDHPLREIPWDEAHPAFYVTSELDPSEEPVRPRFTKPFVYYVGSHQNCGCGFGYDTMEEEREAYANDPQMWAQAVRENTLCRESVSKLREYLLEVVESGPVEAYSVWSGDEGYPPAERLEVTPSHFGGEVFTLKERQLLLVSPE